jgi:hypothetical protein
MHHYQYAQNSCDTVYPRNMVCFRYISVNMMMMMMMMVMIIKSMSVANYVCHRRYDYIFLHALCSVKM